MEINTKDSRKSFNPNWIYLSIIALLTAGAAVGLLFVDAEGGSNWAFTPEITSKDTKLRMIFVDIFIVY